MKRTTIALGFEVGTGAPVSIPLRHMAVTGQTQEAGKTTTLEALIQRSGLRAIVFLTKRGEGSFGGANIHGPYFREEADWQFVASLLEASRHEKLKFERAWIIRASKGARTLADVHRNVRKAMETAKGMSADVYLTLDAYLEAIVPQISGVQWANGISLKPGVNAMDLTDLTEEMQGLVIRSTLDWVLNKEQGTVVVIPEAWKFIPQGRNTPVKLAAERYIRQAAGLHNFLWLDSQDIAGIDKIILKSVPVWLLGVQRESNEVKRTLDQIPASVKKPKAADIATLKLGEFIACYGTEIHRTYVQPAWMDELDARTVAVGGMKVEDVIKPVIDTSPPRPAVMTIRSEPAPVATAVEPVEPIQEGSEDGMSKELERQMAEMLQLMRQQQGGGGGHSPQPSPSPTPLAAAVAPPHRSSEQATDFDRMYQEIKSRLIAEAPALLRLAVAEPSIELDIVRPVIKADGSSLYGRIARLIKESTWFDGDPKGARSTFSEVCRLGYQGANNTQRELDRLTEQGFLTKEAGGYKAVASAKARIVEKK